VRSILCTLGLAGLAALAAGCLGSGSAAPNTSTGPGVAPPTPAPAPPATRVVVRYALSGRRVSTPAMLGGDCPTRARCHAVRLPGSRPQRWELVASRTLTCDPDSGGYARPAAACRALRDLARLEARKPHGVCMCVLELAPIPTAVGHIDRRHVSFDLDACSACGLGGHAGRDMRILTPA
jgi:hypothetical protein